MSHKQHHSFLVGLAVGVATYIPLFLLSLAILGPPSDFNAESWLPMFFMWNCVVFPVVAVIIGVAYSRRKSNRIDSSL